MRAGRTSHDRRWRSVAVISIANSLVACVASSRFLFADPVAKSLGCTYADAMRMFSWIGFMSLPTPAVIGYIVNRLGTRRVALAGLCIATVSCWLAARSQSIGAYGVLSALIGAGVESIAFSFALPLISDSSEKNTASLAFGTLLAVGSIGGTVGPVVVGHVISKADWRVALQGSSFALLVLIPVTLWAVPTRRHRKQIDAHGTAPLTPLHPGSIRTFITLPAFWLPTSMQMLAVAGVGGIQWLLVPYLISRDYSMRSAAICLAATNLSSVPASLIVGVLGQRYNYRLLLILGLSICAASVPLLLLAGTSAAGYMAMVAFVTIWGGANVVFYQLGPLMMADVCKDALRFSFPYGMSECLIRAAGAGGLMVIGTIYDYSRNYTWAIYYCCLMTALSTTPVVLSRWRWR